MSFANVTTNNANNNETENSVLEFVKSMISDYTFNVIDFDFVGWTNKFFYKNSMGYKLMEELNKKYNQSPQLSVSSPQMLWLSCIEYAIDENLLKVKDCEDEDVLKDYPVDDKQPTLSPKEIWDDCGPLVIIAHVKCGGVGQWKCVGLQSETFKKIIAIYNQQ